MLSAAGALARQGVLVRNLQGLEALASVDTVVFDKTGTLTREGMAVRGVHRLSELAADDALALAAMLARHSLHPVSRALVAEADRRNAATSECWRLEDDARDSRRWSEARGYAAQAIQALRAVFWALRAMSGAMPPGRGASAGVFAWQTEGLVPQPLAVLT